jgi:tRNA-specific 2-thiouridylase
MTDGSVRVTFDEPQRAIARGQFAAFYDRDILVGGGVIAE